MDPFDNNYFNNLKRVSFDHKVNILGRRTLDTLHEPGVDPTNAGNALRNYETWLSKREKIHKKLSGKLQRKPGELLMNIGDELNEVKEEKRSLEYARIPQKFDKWRGNPAWWLFPPSVGQKLCKCPCENCKCASERRWFYTKSTVEKNEIPQIDRIGTPSAVKAEKMIVPRVRNLYQKWTNLDYRNEKVSKLSGKLERIIPHKPDFKELVVLGRNIRNVGRKEVVLEDSHDDARSACGSAKNVRSSLYDMSLRICLKINGVFLYEDSPILQNPTKFYVIFEYDIQTLSLKTQHITFENVGRVTIRIVWKESMVVPLFRDFSRRRNNAAFCFDKDVLILVPGQIVNFPIWFHTSTVCTFSETWEIETIPQLWPKVTHISFLLYAHTSIVDFKKRIKVMKSEMNQKAKRRVIKEILDETLAKTKCPHYKSIDYAYFEPELFEAFNFDEKNCFGALRQKFLYDKDLVNVLKRFYQNVRMIHHPSTWDLNLKNLQVLAREKDIFEYAKQRTIEYRKFRLENCSRSNLAHENTHELRHVTTPNEEISEKTMNLEAGQTWYGFLMKIMSKLVPQTMTRNRERLKYAQIFSILNACFTKISVELSFIKPFKIVKKEDSLEENLKVYKENRLIFEYFDDLQQNRTKRTIKEDHISKPKPEILQGANIDDVDTFYKLYQQNCLAEIAGSKGKLKSPVNKTEDVIQAFDPYLSNLTVGITSKTSKMSVKSTPPTTEVNLMVPDEKSDNIELSSTSKLQNLNLYVTIYNNLCEFITTISACLDSGEERKVSYDDLEHLKSCFTLFIDEENNAKHASIKPENYNPFEDETDREYFEKIYKAHSNEITQKYFINGQLEETRSEFEQKFELWSDLNDGLFEVDEGEEACSPSIFSLPKRVPDEVTFGEHAVQTKLSSIRELKRGGEGDGADWRSECECPSDFWRVEEEETKPAEEFYYSDDEEFITSDNLKMKKARGSRVSHKSDHKGDHGGKK